MQRVAFMFNLYFISIAVIIILIIFKNIGRTDVYSLRETLNDYGFKKSSQKQALEDLMRYANIIKANQSFQNFYPRRYRYSKLLKDILSFVQATQQYFTLREDAQERWEVKAAEWTLSNKARIIEDLRTLGFVEAIPPTLMQSDAICILGTTFNDIKERIDFVAQYLGSGKLKTENIILLAGERKVSVGADGLEQDLLAIAAKHNISGLEKLTETHLMQTAFEDSAINAKFKTFIIDTPAGDLPRPTTETTLKELLKWLDAHKDIKKITFVSNQPYIKYQEAIIAQALKSHPDISYKVIGPEVKKDIKTFEIVEGLGSYIWAKTPWVIFNSGKFSNDEKLFQEFKKLYSKNPLIYSDIESLFKAD